MRAAAQGRVTPGEGVAALADEIESKKHRRDPFGERYVALVTSEFGGAAQDGGRSAVEAATTNVHVRVELIRSMKNALVKQTQEAVKRSTQTAVPPTRPRLGTRGRQAAAAAAAAAEAADAEDEHAGDEGTNSEAAFFCDELHQELEQLLSGGGLETAVAANLAAAQEAVGAGRDGTRLPPSDLSLPVEGELAPPPFDALVQQLFGTDTDDSQAPAPAAAASQMPPDEAAGLAAAVQALQLRTTELESRGVLLVAGMAAEHWLLPDGSSGAQHVGGVGGLTAYLHAAQPADCGQPFFKGQPPPQQRRQGSDDRYQHWPAPAAGEAAAAAAAESYDAIQEADEAPDWSALEGEALAPQRHPALHLNLQAQRQGGAAAGGVLVTFDDDRQQQAWQQQPQQPQQPPPQQQQALKAGQARWQPPAQQGQVTLSDVWESGDGGMDLWMDPEEGGSYHRHHQQQQQQPAQPGAPRVPTFAPRPGRQQLALAHSQPQQEQQTGFAAEGIEDEDWDEGMLEQMAALEQQALQERQQAQPSGQPSQQQPATRHVPLFRSRTFQQQALPASSWLAESIEDADSDEEWRATAAGGSPQAAAAAAAGQRGAAGAVPQLGRRAALPLAGQASAAAPVSADGEEGLQAAATAPTQQQQRGQRGPAAAGAAGAGGQPALLVDFSTIDVESLRPSVLLRQQAGGRPKWRPVFDPEQLLLQPLRSALRPPPLQPVQRQPAGGSRGQAGWVQPSQPGNYPASDLLAGITAADLEDWNDWGDEEGVPDVAGFDDASGWVEAAGHWGGDRQGQPPPPPPPPPPPQQQQQWQEAVAVSWDEPLAAVEQEHDMHTPAAPASLLAPPAAAASPAARTVQFQPLVELAFDYDDGGSQPAEQQHEQSQPSYGASQPPSQQQQVVWPSRNGSMGSRAPQPEGGSGWQQGFGWQQLLQSQPQHRNPGDEPAGAAAGEAAADPWASLEQAEDEQGSQGMEEGQQTVQPEALAAQHAGNPSGGAASPAGGPVARAAAAEADPWAALGGEVEDAAADGLAGGSGWFSQLAVGAAAESSPAAAAAVAMASDSEADAYAGGGCFGGWALDVEWEDAGPAAGEQPPPAAQQRQLATGADAPSSARGPAAEEAATAAEAAEAAPSAMKGVLEWGYDEPEQATEPAAAPGAGSLAARLAALGVLDPSVPAAAAVAAGKRRHEQIGAEIIQALLEERRRARVDLQPLLQQLSSRLGQALAGGSGSGTASSGSSGVPAAATLSAVRQACLDGGGPGVQASMQRYLVALLTAAHQHNSGAAGAAAAEGEGNGGAAAPAAAVAPLAAALAGKQLVLHAPGGATDVQIAAA